jgi:hypothetical protein
VFNENVVASGFGSEEKREWKVCTRHSLQVRGGWGYLSHSMGDVRELSHTGMCVCDVCVMRNVSDQEFRVKPDIDMIYTYHTRHHRHTAHSILKKFP